MPWTPVSRLPQRQVLFLLFAIAAVLPVLMVLLGVPCRGVSLLPAVRGGPGAAAAGGCQLRSARAAVSLVQLAGAHCSAAYAAADAADHQAGTQQKHPICCNDSCTAELPLFLSLWDGLCRLERCSRLQVMAAMAIMRTRCT